MSTYEQTPIGFKDGKVICISDTALAQKNVERDVKGEFGLIKRYPVQTDMNGRFVMVEEESQEDAIDKYCKRKLAEKLEVVK